MNSHLFKQRTIAKSVSVVGIGLHKGEPIKLTLEPLGVNSGIVFYRSDKGVSIEANANSVVDTKMATVIGKDGVTVSTIEHFLSAVYAYGIDNLRVIVDGPEVPVMDGSSISFCMMLDEAGIQLQESNKKLLLLKKEVSIKEGEKFVKITPSNALEYNFEIDFKHPVIGKQKYDFRFSKQAYIQQIARARTFGFLHEVQALRKMGLALGGSFENAIVLDDKKILNSEGLRYKDEFVRHKILDAIGDLNLLGLPIVGKYEASAGSHHLNHLLTKEILSSEENYEIQKITSDEEEELVRIFS
jgi:UDP-3-O-[3-hydroxymyristoyl] N-acetylglucosamine deacetylase